MYGAPIKSNSYNIYIWNFAIETKLLKKVCKVDCN